LSSRLAVVLVSALSCGAPLGRAQAQQPDPALQDSLKGLSLEQLGHIDVTSVSKSPVSVVRTPAAVYVITQQDIRRSGATSLPEALRMAPGVEVAQIDGVKWAIGIRGFQGRLSRAVLVLIDGRSVYSPLFHGVYWEVQDTLLEDIDRIEVIRGPGGTIWGPDAVDGVINIITKNARDTHGMLVSAGGGNVNQGYLDLRYGGGNDNNFSYRVYAKGSVDGPEYHSDNAEFDDQRRAQGGFRMDWEPTGRDTLTIQGDGYDGSAGESVRITSLSPPYSTIVNQDAELSGANALARWNHIFGGGSDIQIQFYYDRVRRRQANQAEDRDTYDFDLVHHLALTSRQDFIWGVGARVSPAYLPAVVPTYYFTPDRRTDQLYSGFFQDEISLLPDRLSFTVGVKVFHSSFSGFNNEPSVRLLWTPSEHQSFWAAVTRAVRTPSDNEDTLQSTTLRSTDPLAFNVTTGDGIFTSETDLSYELGYRQLILPGFSVDLATFYNSYNHLESLEPGTPYTQTTNGQTWTILPFVNRNGLQGTTKGFELAPSWKPATWWRLQGSYSYLDMDLRTRPGSTDITSVTSEDASSPRHVFAFQSFLDLPHHLEFSQIVRSVSVLAAQLTPRYETADVRMAWQPIPHVEFAVTGQNLLQPHHVEYGGDPGPLVGIKRSVIAAITWRK
jgi:iron complex outermembrane receptor protein